MDSSILEQGSADWIKARCGCLGASRLHEAVARIKTGWGASRANLMADIIAERLTGVSQPSFTSAAMQWGTEQEPFAVAAYEFYAGVETQTVGFVMHPSIKMTGASPDRLVGDDGLLEIKCPLTATHIETLLGSSIDKKYMLQMQWQMACKDRQWCDFGSFDPRLPEELRLHIRRVPRDADLIASLEKDVTEFLAEVDAKIEALYRYKSA